MPEASRSGLNVPYGADETAYVVVDSLGAGREAESERADLGAVISDLLSGQFNCPIRIVAFNTLEHWATDVSRDVAAEIQSQSDMNGLPVPEHLKDFVDRYTGPAFRPVRSGPWPEAHHMADQHQVNAMMAPD
jgi:hypothetical protein